MGHPDHRMREVETAAATLGISDSVDFLGYVDDFRLAETWASAGALVFPSLHEGFGVPLIEAMSYQIRFFAATPRPCPKLCAMQPWWLMPGRLALADGLQRLAATRRCAKLWWKRVAAGWPTFRPRRNLAGCSRLFDALPTNPARWRNSGYHAIDRLIESLAIFALPAGSTTVRVRTRPLGIARTLEFWSGQTLIGRVSVAAHETTEGGIPLPPGARVLSLRVPDASRLSPTDPRTHGVLLDLLQAAAPDAAPIDLLAD